MTNEELDFQVGRLKAFRELELGTDGPIGTVSKIVLELAERERLNRGEWMTDDLNDRARTEMAKIVRKRVKGVRKQSLNLRLHGDLIAWFRATGPGYQARMAEALEEYRRKVT